MGGVSLSHTIVAGNPSGDINAATISFYSLIGNNRGSGLAATPSGVADANGNLVGSAAAPINPFLGPLADNGGPT